MSEVHHYTLVSKNNMTADHWQLYDLVRVAGIRMHPDLFKIIMDLLAANVPPHAVLGLLKDLKAKIPFQIDCLNDNHISNST